jgi:hypothetical protein
VTHLLIEAILEGRRKWAEAHPEAAEAREAALEAAAFDAASSELVEIAETEEEKAKEKGKTEEKTVTVKKKKKIR